MIRKICLATFLLAAAAAPVYALERTASTDSTGNLDSLISRHAAANGVPEELVRRVIRRESRGNPRAVNAGNYGLMQIRLGTARAMGYRGDARGLLDADTNMTYAVKYLAGAYRVAGGNQNRAVSYYAAGYYYAAKPHGGLEAVASSGGGINPFSTFASALEGNASAKQPVDPAARLREERARGAGIASSSDIFTGKPDYY